MKTLEFSLANPNLAPHGEDGTSRQERHRCSLADFAHAQTEQRVLEIAGETGPLFGASAHESLASWTFAMAVAREALTLQEAINGTKPLAVVSASSQRGIHLAKTKLKSARSRRPFTVYSCSFALGAHGAREYELTMPAFPWFRKFGGQDTFDYAVMTVDSANDDNGTAVLSASLLSFEREITPADFATMCAYFNDEPFDLFDHAASVLPFGREAMEEANQLAVDDGLSVSPELELAKADFPHMQRLVHALASIHLERVTLDLFHSTGEDNFMSFPCYLAYLWYEFAQNLGVAKVGYCEQCGQGFSLVGHRGQPRRFCSEACKTKAKNKRTKAKRDQARRQFFQERLPFEEVLRRLPNESRMTDPRKTLQGFLRHAPAALPAVREALSHPTAENRAFVEECLEEHVIDAQELEQLAARRQRDQGA